MLCLMLAIEFDTELTSWQQFYLVCQWIYKCLYWT
jgi:hypothetical protein